MKLKSIPVLVVFLLGALSSLQAKFSYPPSIDGAEEMVYKKIDGVELKLWAIHPTVKSSRPRPAIVLFFGGGWNAGSPEQFAQQARHLARRGMVAIVADYRVRNRHNTLARDCVADARDAVRFVRTHAQQLGIAPDRIAVGGGSAGGHIAACLGTIKKDEMSWPNAMALFNPACVLAPLDGRNFWDRDRSEEMRERMGVDPVLLSPAHQVTENSVPAIVFHGEDDPTVPFASAAAFAEKMKAAGVRCDLVGYPGEAHGFFNPGRGKNKSNRPYIDTLKKLDAFFVDLGWIESRVPMNVLFIAADDMNCDLGVYGDSLVKTPNLERLAKMGVRFDRAYCQQPLCGPSRASLMTGLRPDTLDMHTLKHELRQKNPDVITLGQLFQQNGYYSYRSGKIYHYGNPSMIGTDANDDPATWTERNNPAGIDKTREPEIINYGPNKGLGISMAWWDPESRDEEHTDGMVASDVIGKIREYRDKPFFLAAGFFNPHCPYVAPKKYFDLYPMDQITMQDLESAKADLDDVPPMAIQRDTRNWPYYFKGISEDQARKCKQAYYACNSFVDAQVGRLLDALEENDLIDKTIIVFWSDHGYFLGEKGLWYKRKAFERSARMPLLIAAPGLSADEASTAPVELLDLYPTLADLCGLVAPAELEGESLKPLLVDPDTDSWSKAAVTQVWHNPGAWGYSIRTERWRYTEWLQGKAGKELYDHDNDPQEITNLADRSEHAGVVAQLSSRLKNYVRLAPEKRAKKGKGKATAPGRQ